MILVTILILLIFMNYDLIYLFSLTRSRSRIWFGFRPKVSAPCGSGSAILAWWH
jgi:hypothetical protein